MVADDGGTKCIDRAQARLVNNEGEGDEGGRAASIIMLRSCQLS